MLSMEESVRLSQTVVDAFTNAIHLIEETLEALRLASPIHDTNEKAKTREMLKQREDQILERYLIQFLNPFRFQNLTNIYWLEANQVDLIRQVPLFNTRFR